MLPHPLPALPGPPASLALCAGSEPPAQPCRPRALGPSWSLWSPPSPQHPARAPAQLSLELPGERALARRAARLHQVAGLSS